MENGYIRLLEREYGYLRDRREHAGEIGKRLPKVGGRCIYYGCKNGTSNMKPFCPKKHLYEHAYAHKIKREWEEKLAAVIELESGGKVEYDCHLFEEVIIILNGIEPRSVRRLARILELDPRVMKRIVNYMRKDKLVRFSKGDRGKTLVWLI